MLWTLAIVVLLGIGFLFGPAAVMILVFLGVGLVTSVILNSLPDGGPGGYTVVIVIAVVIALGIGGFFAKITSFLR